MTTSHPDTTHDTTATATLPAPCPWCGNADIELHTREFIATGEDGSPNIVRHVAVVCDLCRARGAFGLTRTDAVAYWNRVAQPVIQAREATDREEHAAEQARMDGLLPDTARGGQ